MKRLILVLGLMLAAACGGELGSYDEPEQADDLGELEQATRSDNEMGFQAGATLSAARCPVTFTSTTNCVLPPDKQITFRVTGTGMSASQKTTVEGRVDNAISFWLDNAAGARDVPAMWTLQRITGNADVNIEFGTLDGTNKNSINTYARLVTVPLNPLDDFGATGSWNTYGAMTCRIDNVKINNDFTLGQRPKVQDHAIQTCMVRAVGIGGGGGVGRPYSLVVTPDAFKNTDFAAKPRCWLNNYVSGGFAHTPFNPPLCASETDN